MSWATVNARNYKRMDAIVLIYSSNVFAFYLPISTSSVPADWVAQRINLSIINYTVHDFLFKKLVLEKYHKPQLIFSLEF